MALPAPFAALVEQAGQSARSLGQVAAVYAALGLAALLGLGFLLAALFMWLAALTDVLVASLILGGVFVAAAGIGAAVMIHREKERRKRRKRTNVNAALLASGLSLADTGLRMVSRSRHPMFWPAAATLIAAWYLTSKRPTR